MRSLLPALPVLAALVLAGCTRTVYEPVENTGLRTDTVTHYVSNTDSVTVIEHVYESDTRYDSVAPILDSLNRVIGWDRYHFRESTKKDSREMQRLQSLVDSLKSTRADSVEKQVPYPVEKTVKVERPLSWLQKTMIALGWAFVGLCVFGAAKMWLRSKVPKI